MILYPTLTAATPDQQTAVLSAPVHDPVWMLTRQWQTGGFIADDGGAPIHVRLGTVTAPLTIDGEDIHQPLEPAIEAEPLPHPHNLDTASRIRMAAELIRLLRTNLTAKDRATSIGAAIAAAYPMHPVTVDSELLPYHRRLPDAADLYLSLLTALNPDGTGAFPPWPGVEAPEAAAVEAAGRAWFTWMTEHVDPATITTRPPHWDSGQLAYTFTAATATTTPPTTLTAPRYNGDGLDWYQFDRVSIGSAAAQPTPDVEVRPVAVAYNGMPDPPLLDHRTRGTSTSTTSTPSEPRPPSSPPSPTSTATTGSSFPWPPHPEPPSSPTSRSPIPSGPPPRSPTAHSTTGPPGGGGFGSSHPATCPVKPLLPA